MKVIDCGPDLEAANIAIVASRYNSYIVDRLIEGAESTLKQHQKNTDHSHLIRVPGAFEIPVVVDALARTGSYDGIVTLGAVVRGETPHFDYICQECARGINQLSLQYHLPIAFGVLTVDTADQALARSGDEESNKGSEAMLTVLETINVMRALRDG